MHRFMRKFMQGQKSAMRIFLLLFALLFAGSFTGCGEKSAETEQQEELSQEELLELEDMEEEILDEDEIAASFETELMPLDEEELAMMENADGDASLEDDNMTSLEDEDLEDPDDEGFLSDEDAALDDGPDPGSEGGSGGIAVTEDGTYTSKEEVAVYIHTYGHLPSNYITKKGAQELGWESSEGNLDEVAPGKSIGGDRFGNYEGLLPKESGRTYQECDIDFDGGYRNEKRIIYSNDGLIFYTGDHYETFEQLY